MGRNIPNIQRTNKGSNIPQRACFTFTAAAVKFSSRKSMICELGTFKNLESSGNQMISI